MLQGWPLWSLAEGEQRLLDAAGFRAAIAAAGRGRGAKDVVLTLEIGAEGSAAARYRDAPLPQDGACRALVQSLCSRTRLRWPAQHLLLLDQPCYVVVETGALLLEDGRIVAESIFPSTGAKTIERQLGGGLSAETLAENLRAAPVVKSGVRVPLLSRWSGTYFHALSESLVQDTLIAAAGLSAEIRYLAPAGPLAAAQRIVAAEASAAIERHSAPVVKVPAALFWSGFYRHSALGEPFRRFAARAIAAAGEDRTSVPQRIYVSRLGARARPMINEAALIARLEQRGFHIFAGDGQPLAAQVRAFRGARLIVGPHGAGLTNLAFAAPGATLCELRPLNTQGQSPLRVDEYLQLSALMGAAYCAHVSANPKDSPQWEAPLDEIVALIEAIA